MSGATNRPGGTEAIPQWVPLRREVPVQRPDRPLTLEPEVPWQDVAGLERAGSIVLTASPISINLTLTASNTSPSVRRPRSRLSLSSPTSPISPMSPTSPTSPTTPTPSARSTRMSTSLDSVSSPRRRCRTRAHSSLPAVGQRRRLLGGTDATVARCRCPVGRALRPVPVRPRSTGCDLRPRSASTTSPAQVCADRSRTH